jgi:hypothetical protein
MRRVPLYKNYIDLLHSNLKYAIKIPCILWKPKFFILLSLKVNDLLIPRWQREYPVLTPP